MIEPGHISKYTVEDRLGCRIISYPLPMRDLGLLMHAFAEDNPDAVNDNLLSAKLKAFVMGSPQNLMKLRVEMGITDD